MLRIKRIFPDYQKLPNYDYISKVYSGYIFEKVNSFRLKYGKINQLKFIEI